MTTIKNQWLPFLAAGVSFFFFMAKAMAADRHVNIDNETAFTAHLIADGAHGDLIKKAKADLTIRNFKTFKVIVQHFSPCTDPIGYFSGDVRIRLEGDINAADVSKGLRCKVDYLPLHSKQV